jgi:hypothetical protein
MIDIVIPLIKNDYWGEEIRYALRSIDKNFLEDFKVHIIGYCPEWCQNVNHIPFTDDRSKHSDYNMNKKLKIAMEKLPCFIWTYDDIYLIKPVNLDDIKQPKVIKDLTKSKPSERENIRDWQKLGWDTYDRCMELGLSGYNAEIHLPFFYESEKLARAFELFRLEAGEHLSNTAYFNRSDFGDAKFLNHDNLGLTSRLKKKIKKLFPEKSKFEK